MTINISKVAQHMESNGFEQGHTTQKVVEYKSKKNGKSLYFRTEIGLPSYIRLVVHPLEDVSSMLLVTGVEANKKELQHGSNMLKFPKRKNKGKGDIHYGKALNVSSLEALAAFSVAFHSL